MAEEKNVFQKIGDMVVNYAPTVAGLLAVTGVGAPAAAALTAVASLGKAFGLGTNATPEAVLSAVSIDPELALKAQIAENDFKAEMGRQENERLRLQLADVQSARDMNVAGIKATGKRDIEDKAFDWMIVVGFFAIIGCMFYFKPPESTMLGSLITIIGSAVLQVLNFRKGSNASSDTKTKMIYNSTPNQPKVPVEVK